MARTRASRISEPRHVAVLYSLVGSLGRGGEKDMLPDRETPDIALGIRAALAHGGLRSRSYPIRHVDEIISALREFDPAETVVFNLCESLDASTSDGEIAAAREIARCGFAYTGANPDALARCLDKGRTHDILKQAGVPVPEYQIFTGTDEAVRVPYPAIVKPSREDCSLAIDLDSVVESDEALMRRVRYIQDTYDQPALVEQFLFGREFSVSVWGYRSASVVGTGEIDFSSCPNPRERMETFENKWTDRFPGMYPARISSLERRRLERLGLDAYRSIACTGYGRVDVREHEGSLYVLEVNPNPSLAVDAGFARAASASGIDYVRLARRLIHMAWKAKERVYDVS